MSLFWGILPQLAMRTINNLTSQRQPCGLFPTVIRRTTSCQKNSLQRRHCAYPNYCNIVHSLCQVSRCKVHFIVSFFVTQPINDCLNSVLIGLADHVSISTSSHSSIKLSPVSLQLALSMLLAANELGSSSF